MAQYNPDLIAKVVAAVLEGQSMSAVAREYRIPKGTVSSWVKRNAIFESDNGGGREIRDPKKEGRRELIGDLIIDNLEAQLNATKTMANAIQDEEWIRKQPASEIAVLFGVIADKTFRILEALPDDDDEEKEE
jgi:transposase-like protein